MKILVFLTLLIMPASPMSLYEFKMAAIDGKSIDFSQYKGKTVLIVNVASKCGYTPQYADLQKLQDTFGSKVVILGFPANNFGAQEPGTNAEISSFCQKNYGVTFQMFEKISVKGEDQHPLYAWLKEKTGQEPSWNFCKYLIKPDGSVKFFKSSVNPMANEITSEL
ncbi:MAG: glutathione peroxidase [Cyclobacteriaceae bacterium]|jgi:glutathione peroxidase|nr:glutathione peroxidase [Cytophagales bacterium]HNP76504.1 glutathione peroxidase [Cyclobacteriaceae bacterium]